MGTTRNFVTQASALKDTQPKYAKEARFMLAIGLLALWLAFLPEISVAQDDSVLPPGTYRLEMIMATVSRLPFLGSSKSASKSVSMVEVRREGSDLIQSHQVCDFRVLEDSAMIKMVFSDKFIAALGKHTYPVKIEKDSQGWLYRQISAWNGSVIERTRRMAIFQRKSTTLQFTIGTETAIPAQR